ncbi:hypothetical protein FIBSPDRAFT_942932 [Athelia psychrophila]|uniref:DUF6532 domain-containing protein n=1 Tax=Athelia psychrophila TaxID=1759441 RepID=A0A166WJ88_9AGAM|nr:hypothetical protein FIBSPDRAFT_942932 [Fibularhizoctonia sp. CBS 109695]
MVETRADNAAKRPGLIDVQVKATRRSSAQVAEAALAKQQLKDQRAAVKDAVRAAQAERLQDVTASASAEDAAYATPAPLRGKRKAPLTRTESVDLEALFMQEVDEMDRPMQPPPQPATRRAKQKPATTGASMGVTPVQSEVVTSRRTARSVLPQLKPTLAADAGDVDVTPAQRNTHPTEVVAPPKSKSKSSSAKPQAVQNISKDRTFAQVTGSAACTADNTSTVAVGLASQTPGFRVRPGKNPVAKSGGSRKLDGVVEVQADPHSRPSAPSKSDGAAKRGGAVVANTSSRQQKADAPAAEDSVTEDDSIEVQSRDLDNNGSVTEDDSQDNQFVPNAVGSETEDSDQPPPKKRSKAEPKDLKGKAKEGSKGGRAQQSGRAKIEESSEVEVVEEKINPPVKKAVAVAVKKPAAPADRSSHQKPLKDKTVGAKGPAGSSNTYLKPNFSGTKDVANWSAGILDRAKPSSGRDASTPSLTNGHSNGSRATSATRPPSSVVSRASALSNNGRVQIFGPEEDHLENGAISERDETQGAEYEAKKLSPIKGKVRLTSTHKVKVEPGIPAPIPVVAKVSRASNQKLPDRFQEGTVWKSMIIPSMIMWAATQPQIFRIPSGKMAEVLGVVCRLYYEDESITFEPKDPAVSTVSQRLMDQFRGPIGSAAVAIVLAYLASCPKLRDSDEKHVEHCEMMLDDYRFIYENANGPLQRKWKRPFQSGLIVQCFSSYLSATKNVPWLLGMYPNSEDRNTPRPEPRPALALATAAVERALQYVAEGRITLATIEDENPKDGKYLITADVNRVSGKRAAGSVAFSDELWGSDVRDYLVTIEGLRKSSMDKIIAEARKFARLTRTHEEDDEPFQRTAKSARARIPLNYDADSDDEDVDPQGAVDTRLDGAASEDEMQIHRSDNDEDLEFEDNGNVGEDVEMDYEDGHAASSY